MKLVKPLLAAVAAGALGVGVWATLPAGASSQPAVHLDATAAAATAPSPAASSGARCETGEWPDAATGQPAGFQAGATRGYYLWHNAAGWHLEVTHASHEHMVFSGWFSTNGTVAVQRVDDEHNDLVKEGPGDHVVTFALNNYGGVDGVHFETHCADWIQFHLSINGHPAGVEQVYVGHASIHPLAMPFTIDRGGVH
jgi:hypothetical protein